MHYELSAFVMLWSARNGAANWLPWLRPCQAHLRCEYDSGEMELQSRGCVDRGRDSAEHKADLSPFTRLQPSPNLETQEESKVAQMRVSVNTQRELKEGLRREKTSQSRNSDGADIGEEDIFQFQSILHESGSSSGWPAAFK